MLTRRGLVATGMIAPLAGHAVAADPPLTAADLFEDRKFIADISPDGETLATVTTNATLIPGANRLSVTPVLPEFNFDSRVAFRSTSNLGAIQETQVGPANVVDAFWVSNDKLILTVHGNRSAVRRLIVVDRKDGAAKLLLPEVSSGQSLSITIPRDESRVFVRMREPPRFALYAVDVSDGTKTLVDRGGERALNWQILNGAPVFRLDGDVAGSHQVIMEKTPDSADWREVNRVPLKIMQGDDFDILGWTPTPGVLAVSAYRSNDFKGIHEFNVKTGEWGARLSSRDQDAAGLLWDKKRAIFGVAYLDDDQITYDSTDATAAADLKGLLKAFPGCVVTVSRNSDDFTRWIVAASGAQQPSILAYYDRKTHRLSPFESQLVKVRKTQLAPRQMIDIPAKGGGKAIRAYLTGSPSPDAPLLVFPHSGPEERVTNEFSNVAQLFAAQGWVVLQPNFRGSSGYGKAFRDAGKRQWNGLILDDIEASIDQVVASGKASGKKVALFGQGFGANAALLCGARRPQAYRAIVSWCGYYNLNLLAENMSRSQEHILGAGSWQFGAEKNYDYWAEQIGEPKTEGPFIQSSSPLSHGAQITAPVLLVRPITYSNEPDMAAVLRRTNKAVETYEIPLDAIETRFPYRGTEQRDNSIAAYGRVIDFLRPKLV